MLLDDAKYDNCHVYADDRGYMLTSVYSSVYIQLGYIVSKLDMSSGFYFTVLDKVA